MEDINDKSLEFEESPDLPIEEEVDISEQFEISDAEINSLPIDEATTAYIKQVKKEVKYLTYEEEYDFGKKVMNGDEVARQKLILSCLPLVINIAKKYIIFCKHLTFLDLIEYGNEALILSINTFNPDKGRLSTYATRKIHWYIKRSIEDQNESLRLPVWYNEYSNKYLKLKEKNPDISDNEAAKILNISPSGLKIIKDYLDIKVISTSYKIKDDEDAEIGDFIEDKVHSHDDVDNKMADFDLLVTLRNNLDPQRYYIVYKRILEDNNVSLEELGKEFGVTRERIRQQEVKSLRKIKPYLEEDQRVLKHYTTKLRNSEKKYYYKLRCQPITPNDICQYVYLKDKIDKTNRLILHEILFGKYDFSKKEMADYLKLEENDFNKRFAYLLSLMNKLENDEKYHLFKRDYISKHHGQIYDFNIMENYKIIDYDYLTDKYYFYTLNDIKEMLGNEYDKLSQEQKKVLEKYFYEEPKYIVSSYSLNSYMTKLILNYQKSIDGVNLDDLYKIYKKCKKNFSDEEKAFIEKKIFKRSIKSSYDVDKLNYDISIYTRKIESYYYGLNHINNRSRFSKHTWLKVLKENEDLMSEERIKLLNLYYGVNGEALSIKAIALILGIDEVTCHDKIAKARKYAENIYLNRSAKKEFKKDIYMTYLEDPAIILVKENRQITSLHVIEGKTYDAISKMTNKSKTQISNIITDTLRRIDYYRFGIIKKECITGDLIDDFLKNVETDFTEEEINIIKDKYENYYTIDELGEKYNISKNDLNILLSKRFKNRFNTYITRDVKLNNQEIIREVNRRENNSILTIDEKKCISYIMGLKNKYNTNGKKESILQYSKKENISYDKAFKMASNAEKKIKLYKLGYLYTPLPEINIQIASKALENIHVPLNEDEIYLIKVMYGLGDESYKTLEEVEDKYQVKDVRRVFYRAFVTLNKFINGEIEGTYNYEAEIKPNLKYFTKAEQLIIKDLYENNISLIKQSKKYNMSYDKIYAIYSNIMREIYDIITYPNQKRFDFDYYYEAVNDPEFVYDGNLEFMMKIFEDAYAYNSMERKSYEELSKKYNLDISESHFNETLREFMLNICLLKDGHKRLDIFSSEDIINYYNKYKDTMPDYKLKLYDKFIKGIDNSNILMKNKSLSKFILYDLMVENGDKVFNINNCSNDEIIDIIKKYGDDMEKSYYKALIDKIGNDKRKIMTNDEKSIIYSILMIIEKMEMTDEIEITDDKKIKSKK